MNGRAEGGFRFYVENFDLDDARSEWSVDDEIKTLIE